MIEQFSIWRDFLLLNLGALSEPQLSKLARDLKALSEHLSKVGRERRIKAMGEVAE